jgi:ABC-type sugar transport system ATPase subunit
VNEQAVAVDEGVELHGLRKVYGDTVALDALDLVARPGEILGVVGPNGAGKSTMVKILAGETDATAGEIVVDGKPWSPAFGMRRVAVVHQEPQIFPNLTVAENIIIGREGTRAMRRKANSDERAVMRDLALADVADTELQFLPLASRQRTEIARALVQDARVFLFDEPNSALTAEESADLFRRMHSLADAGRVVILVSHRLAEVVAHCDRVAVILDGLCRRVIDRADVTQELLAKELVVGHSAANADVSRLADTDVSLELTGWSHNRGAFSDVGLQLCAGEIVAIMGVEGSGARELVRSIAGFEPSHGRVRLSEHEMAAAPRGDTGFVGADRAAGLFGNLGVGDNLVVRLREEISGFAGTLQRAHMKEIALQAKDQYQIKAASLVHPVFSMSGGNQQKLAIAAAMAQRPTVLVLEEPTRGVDIGSKREIYKHLREYASRGQMIVMYCTEAPEVFEAADRVHVMSDGGISAPLTISAYHDVEELAADITRLERHHVRGRETAPVLPGPV